jgi:outer membrane protein assembly factor BamE (lipoprotein component of BamABCDE complex)
MLHAKAMVLSAMAIGLFAVVPAFSQTTTDGAGDKQENAAQVEKATPEIDSLLEVKLGMTVEEVKKVLGKPEVQDNTGLVYNLDKGDTVQIGLDPEKKVRTIAAVFTADSKATPSFQKIFGTDVEDTEGDVHKMERYPDAGYWVSFSRTNSKEKPVTVVMLRKIF